MYNLFEQIESKAVEVNFSGVISILKGNECLYNKAFGFRDVKNKLPNETNTRFGIASGTKFFTALGIGKLIDQNKLSLNTKVSDIDKGFEGFIDGQATILNLLIHNSGIYDYYDEDIIEDFENFYVDIPWYKLETPSDYYPLFMNKKMKFKPGERYSYSNGGYVFLGMIIEKLANKPYRDFLKEHVLIPGGMYDSGFYAFNDLPENTANGYLEDRKATNIYKLPIRGGGDGGMYTTAYDLNSFWEALLSNKILSKDLTREFLQTQINISEHTDYGCGVYKGIKIPSYIIVGGDAGVGFDSRYILEKGIIVNILSNVTNGEEEMRTVIRENINRL